jgi:glycosyltransferase involved in cell wall biosynthesis
MEAIENVLPFVDEFFILDGKSEDGTLEALELFKELSEKLRIESKTPLYVKEGATEEGLLLGAAFEEARQKCDGDWLIQVQADTVFHPITIVAARNFLMERENAENYDAIKIIRHQYRWNWQEMYREDYLNLIFKKSSGKVFGDAIDIDITGKTTKKLLPVFNEFPATDNAWIFFENIMNKVEGSFEIWASYKQNVMNQDFTWYNEATGRSFKKDLETYKKTQTTPPFWQKKKSAFGKKLPENLLELIGKHKYEISPRFENRKEVYDPNCSDFLEMMNKAKIILSPIKQYCEIWKLYRLSLKKRLKF